MQLTPQADVSQDENNLLTCKPKASTVWYLLVSKSFILALIIFSMIAFFAPALTNQVLYTVNTKLLIVLVVLVLGIFFVISYFFIKKSLEKQIFYFNNDRCVLYTGLLRITRQVIYYNHIELLRIKYTPVLPGARLLQIEITSGKITLYGITSKDADQIVKIISSANKQVDVIYDYLPGK